MLSNKPQSIILFAQFVARIDVYIQYLNKISKIIKVQFCIILTQTIIYWLAKKFCVQSLNIHTHTHESYSSSHRHIGYVLILLFLFIKCVCVCVFVCIRKYNFNIIINIMIQPGTWLKKYMIKPGKYQSLADIVHWICVCIWGN